jgi:hypothetical protein
MSDILDYTASAAPADDSGDWMSKIGGLLGGGRDQTYGGIINPSTLGDARQNALLNFGIGMMNASAWRPGPRASLGQAFAQGAQGAQQAYQGSLDNALKGALTSQQLQAARLSMAKQLMIMRAASKMYGGDDGDATPAAATPAAVGAVAPGGQDAVTSPVSMASPAAMPIDATPAQPVGAQAAPQAAPAPSPMPMPIPQAPSPQAAPQAAPAFIPGTHLTATQLRQRAAMLSTLDPANSKGYLGSAELMLPDMMQAANGTWVNKKDPSLAGQNMAAILDNLGTQNPDGSISYKPGALRAIQQKEAATAYAKAFATPYRGALYDRTGNAAPVQSQGTAMGLGDPFAPGGPMGAPAPQGAPAPGPQGAPMSIPAPQGAAPQDGQAPVMPPLPPGMGPSGPGPAMVGGLPRPQVTPAGGAVYAAPPMGAKEGAETLAKGNADDFISLQKLASDSPDRISTLDAINELAKGSTKFGPGSSERLELIASLNKRLPPQWQFGNDDTANAQIMQKLVSNLSQQYQKALGGTGTDAQLANVLKGLPGPDMMNKVQTEVVPILKRQELALQAKTNGAENWLAAHNGNALSLTEYNGLWRRNYDPRIYMMQQLDPSARGAYLAGQKDSAALRSKLDIAIKNGWIQ